MQWNIIYVCVYVYIWLFICFFEIMFQVLAMGGSVVRLADPDGDQHSLPLRLFLSHYFAGLFPGALLSPWEL